MSVAIEQLDVLSTNMTAEFTIINGNLGIELTEFVDGGSRTIRGRLSHKEQSSDGFPAFVTVITGYQGDVERFDLSKAEKSYLLIQAKAKLFRELLTNPTDAYRIKNQMTRVGDYFGIEGYYNFLKDKEALADDMLYIKCGTGNNSYERTYQGSFFSVGNHFFCYGDVRKEKTSKPFLQDYHIVQMFRKNGRVHTYHEFR